MVVFKHEIAFKRTLQQTPLPFNGSSSRNLRALLSVCQLSHKQVPCTVQYYTVSSKQGQAIKPHWHALSFELIVKLQSA